jgi:oligopeptide transport system ATP-binding protein
MEQGTILDVRHLKKFFVTSTNFFGRPHSILKAVDDVSFSIKRGETLGLVGESGCGKSTTGRTIIHLYKPTAGEIYFEGSLIDSKNTEKQLRHNMQMIFQDPYASLNPRMTVHEIIKEPLDIHGLAPDGERSLRVRELLHMVGLNPAHAQRYPHEFSGGQRQRIGIARALAVGPSFIVCDEPISALDVSIQAQIVNLLVRLQADLGLSYLFIAHNLSMVKHISNRVAVMYMGKIVELADSNELYRHPQHPYTQALLSAIPSICPAAIRDRLILTGDVPNPINPPSGCRFRTRCRYASPLCAEQEPPFANIGAGHMAACHLVHNTRERE